LITIHPNILNPKIVTKRTTREIFLPK